MPPAVLITGGAKRIGAAISRAFGEAGWHVVIHYGRSSQEAEALAASLPSAETTCFDLADGDASVAAIEALAARLDDWRVLINNAGVFRFDGPTGIDPETFSQAVRINAETPTNLAQAFLREANTRGGKRVIHVTDQKLANPNPDFFSYTMSKHALASTIRMLAMAHPDPETRIYGLAPGAILASYDQTEEEIERSHRMNLLHRKTGVREMAEAALFLAEGWLANGETLFVDSGQHLIPQRRDVLFLARE